MLRVYNTLSRQIEGFKPLKAGEVKMFVCGPTVYDYSHIGHARTYIAFDVIAKYLRWRGFNVFYLQNITDLDDKIIQRAKEVGVSPKELAEKFKEEYYKDIEALGINSITKYACATDFIPAIIRQVKTLMERGFAYQIEDGIYYDLSKFPGYGKLSGRTALQAEDAVTRIDESVLKRNKGDFCLWKRSKPDEPKWDSPFFPGRPGWHIEDTAITESHFGPQYDIHGGAQDLIFPHHEAEIAQMEAASGKAPMVKYWLHTGLLMVEGHKMSKSRGNFITIRDILQRYDAQVLRLLIISTHYRSPINFSYKLADEIKSKVARLYNFINKLYRIKSSEVTTDTFIVPEVQQLIDSVKHKFREEMDNDFNTPNAVATIYALVNKGFKLIEEGKIKAREAEAILTTLGSFNDILGIVKMESARIEDAESEKKVLELIAARERARKQKQWEKADSIRDELKRMGIEIRDTKEGTVWRKMW